LPINADVSGPAIVSPTLSQESTDLFNFIDCMPALVASVDCNMVLRFSNKPFKDCFASTGQILSTSFPVVVGKQVFDQIQKHLGRVLVGETSRFNVSVITREAYRYLDVNLAPEFDDQKKVKGFIFHSTDVTEKLNNERVLYDYFQNATIGLHWVNSDGIIVWANPAELKMLGYEPEEYIGHPISKFHKHQTVIDEILRKLGDNHTVRNYEAELICKDGSIRHVTINSNVLWEGQKFIHTRCFTVDVTEQKLAALAARESEDRFKVMADLVPLVIWTTDSFGGCNFLNVRWKEFTGKDVEQFYGDRWLSNVHPEDKEKIAKSWYQCFTAKRPFEARFRILGARGEYAVFYCNSIPRHDLKGSFQGYVGILQDVTSQELIKSSLEKMVLDRTEDLRKKNADLKHAQTALTAKNLELENTNKELLSFAHVASHDLQEPLRKIQTFIDRLVYLEGETFSDKGKNCVVKIQNATQRMRAFIVDLLSYSKSNKLQGQLEYTDLNEVLDGVIGEFELRIEEKKAVIENFGLPSLPVLRFQFHQLFLNLISNALKFSKPDVNPRIQIRSELVPATIVPRVQPNSKNYHHISISDNGIGFDPAFSERIFELFQRLHPKAIFEGTGIGLSICKKIVEGHNGVMIAEGELGVGSTFHMYLPEMSSQDLVIA
jgi:PAS domain S-box-containing protein